MANPRPVPANVIPSTSWAFLDWKVYEITTAITQLSCLEEMKVVPPATKLYLCSGIYQLWPATCAGSCNHPMYLSGLPLHRFRNLAADSGACRARRVANAWPESIVCLDENVPFKPGPNNYDTIESRNQPDFTQAD